MPRILLRTLVLAALLFADAAAANETAIRKALQPKLGGAKIEGVQPGPAGLWEVRVRTARFMASRIIALVEHPAADERSRVEVTTRHRLQPSTRGATE